MNWGIIGYGNIARVFEQAINSLSQNNLIVIKTNKNLKSNKIKIVREYLDFFLTKKLDAVYISNLNNQHFDSAIKCIENQKKFIVEKPALNNLREFNIFKKKIINNPVLFYEGYMNLYYPYIDKILSYIKANKIGKLKKIYCDLGFSIKRKKFGFNFYKIKKNHRLRNDKLGGGAINDIGCYSISFSHFLLNKLNINVSKYLFLKKKKNISSHVEEDAFCQIIYNDEVLTEYNCSIINDLDDKIILDGTDGRIIINNPWVISKETNLKLVDIDGKKIEEIFYFDVPRHNYIIQELNHSLFMSKEKIEKKIEENLFFLERNTEILEYWRDY